MQAIDIEDLSFSYPEKQILSKVSLKVSKGEFVGLVGKTGCGKSTLLLTLNGIIPQMLKGKFSGSVRVFGKDTRSTQVHELARTIAFVFQDPEDQIFSLKVEDEVMFGLSNLGIKGAQARQRVLNALDAVGLGNYRDSDPHTLSHGQKQKLAFACALAIDPEIYVLDEPVSSLDHRGASEIYGVLKKLHKQGKTIIVVEHDTEWLAQNATRILLLNNRKIEADGSAFTLFDKRLEAAGIKIPCALRISRELGESMLTPGQLVEYIKGLKRKR